MVGFLQSPTIEEAAKGEEEDIKHQSNKPSIPSDPLTCISELEDFSASFSDSFLDFDSINGWLMEGSHGEPNLADMGGSPFDFDSVRGESWDSKENFEVCGGGIRKRDYVKELGDNEGVSGKVDDMGVLGGLGCLIEEQLGKVCLEGESNFVAPIVSLGNDENVGGGGGGGEVIRGGADISDAVGVAMVAGTEMKIDKDESGSDEESEDDGSSHSSASASSSSSSSDEEEEDDDSEEMSDEKKEKDEDDTLGEKADVEDGEIILSDADEMVAWGDDEDADGSGTRPITSKNELKDLPPVPPVTVTLEPHHQTLPVGTILSIIGPRVIVEGVEKHNPLSEGSILWITESRLPLGIIDEIFGPVKNPYYIVRYNSETKVPPGIEQGTVISFVQEFANHVLNDKSLYQKGYDASGENDEELSDQLEFSDDEKEAEYRRTLKMKKRGVNESKPGNKRKEKRPMKNQKGNWNRDQDPTTQVSLGGYELPVISEDQKFVLTVGTSLNEDSQVVVPPFSQGPRAPGLSVPNGIWNNSFPHNQQQSATLPTGLPTDGMLWMQQNLPFQFYQTPLQPNAAFQQQTSTIPGMPLNFNAMSGQPNFGGHPILAPWPMGLNQSALNPLQFGMGLQGQHASQPLNGGGDQAVQCQGPNAALNFNQGRGHFGGRRRGHRRGRGHFGGGRGRHS